MISSFVLQLILTKSSILVSFVISRYFWLIRLQLTKKLIDWEWIFIPRAADAAVIGEVRVDLVAAKVGVKKRAQRGRELRRIYHFWADSDQIEVEGEHDEGASGGITTLSVSRRGYG